MKTTWIFKLVIGLLLLPHLSCNKVDYSGEDPYAGAKEALTIRLDKNTISPASGEMGETVTLHGVDFLKYRDSGLTVKFNGITGDLETVQDSLIKVKIPNGASSGLVTLTVLNQVFQGPEFSVEGPIMIDENFEALPGANGAINSIASIPGGQYLIGGSFRDYGNSGLPDGLHGLARINDDGSVDRDFGIGKGIQGTVNTVAITSDGKYVAGGNISNYDERFESGKISNIIRLNNDGSIDSLVITKDRGGRDTIPAFNVYFDGSINKIIYYPFTPFERKFIVLGNFRNYMQKDFSAATFDGERDSVLIDSVRVDGIARLNEDGSFDSTFHYDLTQHQGLKGFNGPVQDAFVEENGRLLVAGNFTSYNNQTSRYVAIIDPDGNLVSDFHLDGGPDDEVSSIARLSNGRYLIGGKFNRVNGQESRKLAVLTAEGELDDQFNVGSGPNAGPDGVIQKVQLLNNNKIFVSGVFNHFNGMNRDGTVVLELNGEVSDAYNNLGAMEALGGVNQILNVPNQQKTILVGSFTKYDLKSVNRITQLKY